jgi:hypothetical protein
VVKREGARPPTALVGGQAAGGGAGLELLPFEKYGTSGEVQSRGKGCDLEATISSCRRANDCGCDSSRSTCAATKPT